MRPAPHFQPPRQSVVYGYTRRMLDATAMNVQSFAMDVAARYCAQTAPDVRTVALKLGEGDALATAMRANAQVLRRYMDGTVKTLPADLEDAWVQALPEPYRSECERDLAARRGRYSMPMLEEGEGADAVGISKLMMEMGRLCEVLAPAMADGVLDEADRPHAAKILAKSTDVIAAVLTIQRCVGALVPERGHG